MNLRHEAILSLNTRVRRLRYLFKAVDLVADVPVSRSMVVQQLVSYGLSRDVYDEVTQSSEEPFSGHFFENVNWSYEKNAEKLAKRSGSSAERVAEGYLNLAGHLGLVVETDNRISASQVSLPMRFIANCDRLSVEARLRLRNTFVLALLLKCDRDLTGAFLSSFLSAPNGVSISDIENNWDSWVGEWLEKLIRTASSQGYGNPIELLRYQKSAERSRKSPRRYAEHVALIRFHWLLDLGLSNAQPVRNPVHFKPSGGFGAPFKLWLGQPADSVIEGDLSALHFEIARARPLLPVTRITQMEFSVIVREFLDAARQRGMSNVRLALFDSVWTSVVAVTTGLFDNLAGFRIHIDESLKSEGIMVVKAPSREQSYIPTQQ